MSKRTLLLMCSIFLIVPLLFLGCGSGDSGAVGATGATGPAGAAGGTGPAGEDLTASPTPEACSVCHRSVATTHAQTGVVTVGSIASALNEGGDLVATFNIKVDGLNSDIFAKYRVYVNHDNAAVVDPSVYITPFVRETITDNITIVSNGSGNYTATVPPAVVIDNSNYLFILRDSTTALMATANVQFGAAHLRDLVSKEGCAGCHGPYPARSAKFSHYAVGGSECQICHSQQTGRNIGIISKNDAGVRVESAQKFGTNLVEYIHGIHKSASMPDGEYYRTLTGTGPEQVYKIGFPSDMKNCKVCHTTTAQLAAAASAPVSYHLCMSCHQKWDGFVDQNGDKIFAADNFHRTFGMTTSCMTCHVELPARNEAADFHDSFESADSHSNSFYRGTDISFDNPNNVGFAITGVTKSGDNVTFTWTASRNGSAVDPCNTDTAGPTFRGLGAYLAYGKGDDWVNENVSNTPGQPAGSRNLFTSLATTCASNVATSTGLRIAAGTAYADKVLLAIGGKAMDNVAVTIGSTPTTRQFFVRVPSPTYAFSLADGAAAAARRNVVNRAKCLSCHRGTLYQHGGDRVDNPQLCVICHNPSAGDKHNRKDRFQIVNADGTVNREATYDGKSNETFDFRNLLHSIHGAEKRDNPIVIYRSRGIYAFATGDAAKPTGWPDDGVTIYGSQNGSTIAHVWTVVHFPQPANKCTACHDAGTYEAPDQTKAAPLTVEPGTSWSSQSDDVVIGPTAAACTACHATSVNRSHALHEGYMANVSKEYMIDMSQPDAFWVLPLSP